MDKVKVLELCMDVRYGRSSEEGQSSDQRKAELVELFSVSIKTMTVIKYKLTKSSKKMFKLFLKSVLLER